MISANGVVIGEGHNEVTSRCVATAHAEIVAMRRVGGQLQQAQLRWATLYSAIQPCGICTMACIRGMCTMACIRNGITRIVIVYGAERHRVHRRYFVDRHFDTTDFIGDAFCYEIRIEGGVQAAECATLDYSLDDNPPPGARTNL